LTQSNSFYTVRGYEIIDKKQKILTHSMEDYLEMIYRSSLTDGYARINTLAESLNVQAPSATKMVQKLSRIGLLRYKKYGILLLTEEGFQLGKFLYERHTTIEKFLSMIGVKENLLINTELIEHNVTNDALKKIESLIRFFEDNPELLKKYNSFLESQNYHD
jgi:DtxR family Mn-dependent transcriptional regulator